MKNQLVQLEYVWHYQTVPEENWDYNANMNIVLADLTIAGELRNALMIAPKNGFFYVLDRLTGELLSAEKYAKVNWASHINLETGRPVLMDEGKFWELPVGESVAVWPNMWGAHSWNPMAYHPRTGLVYIPVVDAPSVVVLHDDGSSSSSVELITEVDGQPFSPGKLAAWDPVAQRQIWAFEHELPFNGGVLATAGNLVFQGSAVGDFSAFDAETGEQLWSVSLGSAINSAPVSYRLNGEQFVLIAAGAGGGMQFSYPELHAAENLRGPTRMMAFSLEGDPELPLVASDAPPLPDLPELEVAPEIAEFGYELYHDECSFCHGRNGRARTGGSVPDLRYATKETHMQWNGIWVSKWLELHRPWRLELDGRHTLVSKGRKAVGSLHSQELKAVVLTEPSPSLLLFDQSGGAFLLDEVSLEQARGLCEAIETARGDLLG